MKLKGIVLAGGRSSRFGSDKATALWEGITLLEHAARLLDELGLDPAVIANADKDYTFLPYPVINDLVPGQGPLEGLFTAYANIPDRDFLVLTCDMPRLTPLVLQQLIRAYAPIGEPSANSGATAASAAAAVFETGGSYQPFPGIYSHALKDRVSACLASDDKSMMYFLKQIPDLKLLRPKGDQAALMNVNHPGDLAALD